MADALDIGFEAGPDLLTYAIYLCAFLTATVTCLWAALWARRVSDSDTRHGLITFFACSSIWGAAYVGFLLVDSMLAKHLFYQASLVVGFGTVWAWLWFCSAYSGRNLHRNRSVQQFAAVLFIVVTALKATNPIHGLYYSLEPTGGLIGPVVSHDMLYWVVMALSYALASTGYLMILRVFLKARASTLPLIGLTGLTALPAVLNMIGHANSSLLDVTHEPLGVAVFAVGFLSVYKYRFEAVRVSSRTDEPTVFIGPDGTVRGWGKKATGALPRLQERGASGKPLTAVCPSLAKHLGSEKKVWKREAGKDEEEARYYRITETSLGETVGGTALVLTDITDQKKRERALREAKMRYKTLINNFPNGGVFLFGEDLRYVFAGGENIGIAGDPEDIVGTTIHDLLPEGLAERHARYCRRALKGKRSDFEQEYEGRLYRIQTLPIRDESGEVISGMAFSRDITDRRRRKNELERKNDLFEKSQDLADVGAWEYDVESGTLTWTKQVYAIHGLPEDMNPTPEKAIEHYHQEDRSRIEEAFTQAIEEGISYDEELRIRRPGGEVRWVRAYGEPQTSGEPQTEEGATETGSVAYVRGAFKDITDRKRRERRANRLRRKYQTLLEGAPDAIVLADQETGRIEEVNQEAAELIGAAPEEIVGRNQAELHPDGEESRYRNLFEEVGKRVAQTSGPETVYRFDDGSPTYVQSDAGEKVPVEISATTIELWGDRLILGIFRDVTERRRREKALREAKEEAQQASELKSAMLANMSHEIRTPLTSIIGFSESIENETSALQATDRACKEEDLSTLNRFAGLIGKGGRRLLDTLDGILNLSKLEAGQMELSDEPVELNAEAEALAEELLPQAEEAAVDCHVETEDKPAYARADSGGVQIVLRNLVSNALKYTGEGGEVRVRVDRTGESVVVEVEDTGIGMKPEVAEHLFEPFKQASEGMSREYEGTGLGLAVARKATEQMDGSLEVETEEGEGSRFTARFPKAEDPTVENQ